MYSLWYVCIYAIHYAVEEITSYRLDYKTASGTYPVFHRRSSSLVDDNLIVIPKYSELGLTITIIYNYNLIVLILKLKLN